MLWFIFGCMLLAAVMVVTWPQYLEEHRLSARSALAIVGILAVSVAIYSQIGEPGAHIATVEDSSVDEMVVALALRLESEPDDLQGWKMLARSYGQLKRYPEAIVAFEQAAELESYGNGQTLVDLGESILLSDGNSIKGRAAEVFENALALSPNNPKALFYGGIAAIERGEPLLAAARWETLLATSPPEEIRGILRQRIDEWRGITSEETPAAVVASNAVEVTMNITLSEAARNAVDPAATVFIIARDPGQPGPPIAVTRRLASELPTSVALSDADAMIAGRTLGGVPNLEIIVRVSASGQPTAQSGDWFDSATIDTGTTRSLEMNISQQVP